MTWLEALILAVIEGLTEYLPISSTGHLVIAATLMGLEGNSVVKVFEISVQSGAILAVLVLYFRRFVAGFRLYGLLFWAFLPAVLVGMLLKQYVDVWLEHVEVVALALLIGGVVLLFVDKWFAGNESEGHDHDGSLPLTPRKAVWIGAAQCLAFVPGVSRSAASIVGGMAQGLTRRQAAEFSFFLAVPTLLAATAKSLWDSRDLLGQTPNVLGQFALGGAVAFVTAMLAIRAFVGALQKYGFRLWGWYRIVLGLAILVLMYGFGLELKMA